jgi:hypothetical protein
MTLGQAKLAGWCSSVILMPATSSDIGACAEYFHQPVRVTEAWMF